MLHPRFGKAVRTQAKRVSLAEPSSIYVLEVESKTRVKSPESESGSSQAVGKNVGANQDGSHSCCNNVTGYFKWATA